MLLKTTEIINRKLSNSLDIMIKFKGKPGTWGWQLK